MILFGSRARGTATGESDYDLLILMDQADHPRALAAQVYRELVGVPASFDVLVRSAKWWEEWWDTPFSLERRIQTEGVVLHDAA